MDGTRDRPPGKSAENWSRRDGIRAGSVSGPWRSAPREEAAQRGQRSGSGPTGEGAGGEHARELRSHRATKAGATEARARGQMAGMVLWIGFGVVMSVGVVIAALLLRPEPAVEFAPLEVPAAAPQPAATAGDAAPAVPPAAVDPALAGVSDVRLRIGPEFPDSQREAILAALAAAGIAGVQVEPLPFRIATSRVGYYRAEDLAAAEALVRLIAPVLANGEVGVRDYGQLLSDAEPGRLDLWVGG